MTVYVLSDHRVCVCPLYLTQSLILFLSQTQSRPALAHRDLVISLLTCKQQLLSGAYDLKYLPPAAMMGHVPPRQALQLRVSAQHQGCWSRCPTSPRKQGQTGFNLHLAARAQSVSNLCLWVTHSCVRARMCVVCFCLCVPHHGHRLVVVVNRLSLPMLTAFTSQGFGAQANLSYSACVRLVVSV